MDLIINLEQILKSTKATTDPPPIGLIIGYSLFIAFFVMLSAILIIIYFRLKPSQPAYAESVKNRAPGSFVGY